MQIGITILENSLAPSTNTEDTHTLRPAVSTPRYILNKKYIIYAPKYVCKNGHSNIICNNQKLEITPMSVKSRMDKYIMVYSYNGMPQVDENE